MYLTIEDESNEKWRQMIGIRDYSHSLGSQESFLTVLHRHKTLHWLCLKTERIFQVVIVVISSMKCPLNVKTPEILRTDRTLWKCEILCDMSYRHE